MTATAVRRLPVENGTSGWEALSRRSFPVRCLEGSVSVDWLIIGAGFAGLSAARRLHQLRPDDSIVLLEASEVAKGPSGRNSGFMIDVPHNLAAGTYSNDSIDDTKREISQNRAAIDFAAAVADECGMSGETFDPSGKINAAATARGMRLNQRLGRSLQGVGEAHEFLDAAEMREITGSDYYLGGLFTPGAVVIQPAAYVHGLAADLAKRIDLFERSPVTALRRDGGAWTAVSPRGKAAASRVIVCVNGHIDDFGHFGGRLMHIFAYASMTVPLSADVASGRDRWALLPADSMGATLRKITSDGQSRIVIRTKFTCETSVSVPERRMAKMAQDQRRSLDARFPGLAGIPFEHSWAGRICLSLNHVPAFGELEEGLYSACCDNGLGTVKSTLAGMMAAELATGTTSRHLTEYMDHPEPSRLPPRPFARLGINGVIRLQELRAGREG